MDPEGTKPKIVVICGPTGIGKTSAALELAKNLQAEIVSADSMQVYRYMNIGTAKPTADELNRVPHHMIDIVNPDEPFDAARFSEMAQEVIDQFDRLTFVGVSAAPSEAAAEKFVAEHCEIIDALQARDRSTVTSLINKHISKSQKQLFAVLENPPIVE